MLHAAGTGESRLLLKRRAPVVVLPGTVDFAESALLADELVGFDLVAAEVVAGVEGAVDVVLCASRRLLALMDMSQQPAGP
jgi:hypothetical protein